jgi:hypothetical protein
MLLHNARLPNARDKKPNRAMTSSLMEHAVKHVPRLKFDMTDTALRSFLLDPKRIGEPCNKFHTSTGNGYDFPPLGIARAAWCRLYGPTAWDNEAEEWTAGIG